MAKTLYNPFDVVKFSSIATILNTNTHAKDYIGIVKEPGDNNSYIEWYDCKSKTATREVTDLTGWRSNAETELIGSLYHLITSKVNALVNQVKASTNTVVSVVPEVRTKRKYTRKPGAAKPGPKPKKDKVVKAVKPKVVKESVVETDTPKIVKVPVPIGKWKNLMTKDWFENHRWYIIPTGKFKYFATREYIEKSITDSGCHLYKKIDYNLDFAIVGEKPGPAKLNKFSAFGIPTITEEQWLALIGAPGFEFDTTIPAESALGRFPLQV